MLTLMSLLAIASFVINASNTLIDIETKIKDPYDLKLARRVKHILGIALMTFGISMSPYFIPVLCVRLAVLKIFNW